MKALVLSKRKQKEIKERIEELESSYLCIRNETKDMLSVLESKVIRMIYGPMCENRVWGICQNQRSNSC